VVVVVVAIVIVTAAVIVNACDFRYLQEWLFLDWRE